MSEVSEQNDHIKTTHIVMAALNPCGEVLEYLWTV